MAYRLSDVIATIKQFLDAAADEDFELSASEVETLVPQRLDELGIKHFPKVWTSSMKQMNLIC